MGSHRRRSFEEGRARVRRRAIIGFIVTVVVLAAVFLISSALSSPDAEVVDSGVVGLDEADEVATARRLLESGQTTEAVDLLRSRLAAVPDDTAAAELLDSIEGDTPEPDDPGSGEEPADETPETPDTTDRLLDPVDDLATLLPGAVEGFTAGIVVAGDSDVQVNLDPVVGSDLEDILRTALVSVHDMGDPEAARGFITSVSQPGYSVDGETFDLLGIEAYYGTDGGSNSTVSFSVGRYAFEVVAASTGDDASQVREYIERIAGAFPALR